MRCAQEAGGEFNFPETITSLSYQLRSIYQRLLWDYEQMYFWRNTGPRVPAVTVTAAPKSEANEARCAFLLTTERMRLENTPAKIGLVASFES